MEGRTEQHLRILIVEDEQIVAADLQSKLDRIGQEVIGVATSGEEAVAMAASLMPDLVLMDFQLRGSMDGAQAAQKIRQRRPVPVIFITAFAEIFARDPVLFAPFGFCLSKPFSMNQLRTILAQATGQATETNRSVEPDAEDGSAPQVR